MPDLWMDVDAALSEVPVNITPLIDNTDFKTIEDAVAYNAAGLALYWHFVTSAGAYTVTAVTPTTAGAYDWTDQGAAGIYTIEIPASGGASINNDTEGFGWFTGVATGILPWRGPVIGFRAAALNDALIDSAWSTTRGLAGTALPAAAADAAGGLPISDAGGLDVDAKLAATNEVTAARMGALTDWINGGRLDLLLDAIKAVTDALPNAGALTDLATAASVSSLASTLATILGHVDTEVAAILQDTGTDIPALIAALNNLSSAQAQTAAAAALTAYDPPTRAEATADADSILSRMRGLVMAQGTIGATGNDTTHLHLGGLTYGNDEINSLLLVVFDVSASEYHARWIEDWVDAGDLATVATLPFTPEASVDTYWITSIRSDVTGGSGLDAAGVRAAVGLASANLDTQLGTIDDLLDTEVAAIKAKTDNLPTDPADASDIAAAFSTVNSTLTTIAAYLDTEIAAILEDTGTTLPAQIAALNNLSAAQVNAEVVDALATDTYAEPGQSAWAATLSLKDKIGFLAKIARNKVTQSATEMKVYNDDGTTVGQKSTVSDDATTYTRGEIGTGP